MAFSSSCVSVQMVPQLSIEGKKAITRRPHTTCGHRKEDQMSSRDDESENGTYVIEGKSERQTRVKLESLERRLRMNEKTRKESDEQLEIWKNRATKAETLISELNAKVMEESRKNQILKEESEDAVAKAHVMEEERSLARESADENEKRLRELCCHVTSLLVDDQQELDLARHSPDTVLEKVKEHLLQWKRIEEENRYLLEQVRRYEERMEKSRTQMEHLTSEMQKLKKMDMERRDEQLQEIQHSHDSSNELKQNLHRLENNATQHQLEIDMLKAEIRCLKSRNFELEQSVKNMTVLTRSAENEKKAFLETVTALLGADDTDEIGIKRKIREMVSEVENCRSEKTKLEAEAKKKENGLLDQAKQLRHALFRARTSEEEISVITEKFKALEQELNAAELELKATLDRLQETDEGIQKLAEVLEIKEKTQLKAVQERVVELVNFENAYSQLFGDGKLASELRLIRLGPQDAKHIDTLKKRLRLVESTGGKKVAEIFDKQLLTQVTLDTIRAADTQKVALKHKLSEQEKKIRNLEKEKRETEKLRNIVSKWERKETQGTHRERTHSQSQSKKKEM